MQSTRLEKIARLLQKELSEIFRLETAKMGGVLVSVSAVRVSPDLAIAHVYLSIFPQNKVADTMQAIQEHTGKFRGELGTLERHQLRIIPELHFHLDDTIDRMEHIDELQKQ